MYAKISLPDGYVPPVPPEGYSVIVFEAVLELGGREVTREAFTADKAVESLASWIDGRLGLWAVAEYVERDADGPLENDVECTWDGRRGAWGPWKAR